MIETLRDRVCSNDVSSNDMSCNNMSSNNKSSNVPECPRRADRLNDKQLAAIELLILGKKVKDVALAVGVERRTVTRWKTDELFREELAKRRAELWSRASQRLASMVHPSLDVLESHLADRYEHIRFRAA